jgi:protein SCO1/2
LKKKLLYFLVLFFFTFCKVNEQKGDIKYLPENWDKFEGINQEGQKISLTSFRGKYKIIYFGFSHCPDMCPKALSNLAKAIELLDKKNLSFQVIFISLDPKRDTPEMLKRYVKMFPENTMQAITFSQTDMQKLLEIFGVFREEKKIEEEEYTIDHSNFLFFLGKTNEQIATVFGSTSPQELAQQIQELIPLR